MTNREAWFAGWEAAKLHSAAQSAVFAGARLQGDRLTWRMVPEPPNPFPLDEAEEKGGKRGR